MIVLISIPNNITLVDSVDMTLNNQQLSPKNDVFTLISNDDIKVKVDIGIILFLHSNNVRNILTDMVLKNKFEYKFENLSYEMLTYVNKIISAHFDKNIILSDTNKKLVNDVFNLEEIEEFWDVTSNTYY